jgi:hypothetical protein
MLPGDDPEGYFQVVEINPGRSVHQSTWLVGIGISATSLDDLWTQVSTIVNQTVTNFSEADACISGLGSAHLSDQIQIEVPDTYTQQAQVTNTNAFKTSVSFGIRITTAI